MGKVYGYCRISRKEQSIERQVRNITAEYPDAIIVREAFTGTKLEGRKGFERIIAAAAKGDTIVFDSVSRMSRNAAEGIALYEDLYARGVNLVFLKEHHIDTATYDAAIHAEGVPMTGTNVDIILAAVNEYLKVLRRDQIKLAFEQAQKEVDDLRQRTKEGMETVKRRNEMIDAGIIVGEEKRQLGGVEGKTLHVKKADESKVLIKKYSKDFDGTLPDTAVMKLTGIARNTYYKYKAQLKEVQ